MLGIDSKLEGEGGAKPFYRLRDCGVEDSLDFNPRQSREVPILEQTLNVQPTLSKHEMEEESQRKLDQYQIIRMLGQGAYAVVKLA